MWAWFRKQIEPLGFTTGKQEAWRLDMHHAFLFYYVNFSRMDEGYVIDLSIGTGSPYIADKNFLFQATNNSRLCGTGIIWGSYERRGEYIFPNSQKSELLEAFKTYALPWFDKWADPHLLINFYRWKMGEDIGPQGKEFQLGGDICDGKPSIAMLENVALLYAHLGQFDEASRYINQVKIIPQINPWVEKARADFAAGHIPKVDLREVLV